jgi:hypothetical protein
VSVEHLNFSRAPNCWTLVLYSLTQKALRYLLPAWVMPTAFVRAVNAFLKAVAGQSDNPSFIVQVLLGMIMVESTQDR